MTELAKQNTLPGLNSGREVLAKIGSDSLPESALDQQWIDLAKSRGSLKITPPTPEPVESNRAQMRATGTGALVGEQFPKFLTRERPGESSGSVPYQNNLGISSGGRYRPIQNTQPTRSLGAPTSVRPASVGPVRKPVYAPQKPLVDIFAARREKEVEELAARQAQERRDAAIALMKAIVLQPVTLLRNVAALFKSDPPAAGDSDISVSSAGFGANAQGGRQQGQPQRRPQPPQEEKPEK